MKKQMLSKDEFSSLCRAAKGAVELWQHWEVEYSSCFNAAGAAKVFRRLLSPSEKSLRDSFTTAMASHLWDVRAVAFPALSEFGLLHQVQVLLL